MLSSALQYAELGYAVFPCAVGAKRPLTSHGVLDATTDAEQIEAWWTATPTANVAISTAGLLVVDFDCVDGKLADWLADEPEKLIDLAAGALSLTPRGGRHYIFREPSGANYRNTAGKLSRGVDTRASGGYILLPPSEVDGKRYQWAGEMRLDCRADQLPEPPNWLRSLLDRPSSEGGKVSQGVAAAPARDNRVARARAYGAKMESAIQGQGGSDRAFAFACELFRFGLSRADAETLFAEYNLRCEPPWSEKEASHKLDDAFKTVAKAGEFGSRLLENDSETSWGVDLSRISVVAAEAREEQGGGDAPPTDSGPADPGSFPDELLEVGGWLGDVAKFSVATAFAPQPVLALAGALPLLGTLTGRKIADPFGTRTNLYTLGVCESGGGKERARQVNKEILHLAGLGKHAGPEEIASSAGLMSAVDREPEILFQLDEIGRVLKTLNNPQAAPHLYGITTALMRMFTSSNSVYKGACYADPEKNRQIINPHACLYGTTVPDSLLAGLSAESVTDGFLSRMLIFEAVDNDPDPQDPEELSMPVGVIDVARYWGNLQTGGNLGAHNPDPRVVPYTDDAAKVMNDLRTLARYERKLIGKPYGTLWTRTVEKARKLALLWACSMNHVDPVVTVEAATWAAKVSEYLTRRMIYLASCWVAENRQESDLKRVQRIIDGAPGGRMTGADLARATQWLTRTQRGDLIASLLESGGIGRETEPTGTKPRTFYVSGRRSLGENSITQITQPAS
jgi:hypothetical protein